MDDEIRTPALDEPCPCGSGLSYGECCGKVEASAPSGEVEVE